MRTSRRPEGRRFPLKCLPGGEQSSPCASPCGTLSSAAPCALPPPPSGRGGGAGGEGFGSGTDLPSSIGPCSGPLWWPPRPASRPGWSRPNVTVTKRGSCACARTSACTRARARNVASPPSHRDDRDGDPPDTVTLLHRPPSTWTRTTTVRLGVRTSNLSPAPGRDSS